jgi:DNA-binding GntR family transcriptional regulator
MVNVLTLGKIRDIYEIIGALEAQTIHSMGELITSKDIDRMDALNQEMRQALEKDDFHLFYEKNLDFHDVYLNLSSNQELVHTVQMLKQRLYDFPRIKGFVKEWEVRSTGEHEDIIHRLRQGDLWAAADYIRDVHWSFKVQERFIRKYYFLHQEEGKNGNPFGKE